jgi:hypothetical protein
VEFIASAAERSQGLLTACDPRLLIGVEFPGRVEFLRQRERSRRRFRRPLQAYQSGLAIRQKLATRPPPRCDLQATS